MNLYPPVYDELLAHLLTFMPMPEKFGSLLFPKLIGPADADSHLQVLQPGETSKMAYWPIKGYLRRYTKYKPEEDREFTLEHTTDISIPKKIYLPAQSFMTQVPVDFHLEFRKGSRYISFSYDSFRELGEIMPEVYLLASMILGDAEADWLQKIEICKVKTKEAYQRFLDFFRDPAKENFILQKQIASYIGKSEADLNRIINGAK